MEYELTIGKEQAVALTKDHELGDLLKPLSREILLFDSYVAGTGYTKAEVLNDLKVGDRLTLRREPDNRVDGNAILLLDAMDRKAGYIPETDNIVFARLMDAGKFLTARINRMEEKGSFRLINISIYLVDF